MCGPPAVRLSWRTATVAAALAAAACSGPKPARDAADPTADAGRGGASAGSVEVVGVVHDFASRATVVPGAGVAVFPVPAAGTSACAAPGTGGPCTPALAGCQASLPDADVLAHGEEQGMQVEAAIECPDSRQPLALDPGDQPPIAAATADGQGLYRLSLPAGAAWGRLSFRVTAANRMATWLVGWGLWPREDRASATLDLPSVSSTTWLSLPYILGTAMRPRTAALVGRVLDCLYRRVENANARVIAGGQAAGGVEVYYFRGSPRPRNELGHTSEDGLYLALGVPGDQRVTLASFGRVGGQERLIGQVELRAFPNALMWVDIEPAGCAR